MKEKRYYLILAALVLAIVTWSCEKSGSNTGGNGSTNDTSAVVKDSVPDRPDTTAHVSNDSVPSGDSLDAGEEEQGPGIGSARFVEGKYVSATMYTGTTYYRFQPEKGDELEIAVPNWYEEGQKEITVPKDMLDPTLPLEEGPPDENPAFVGKRFRVHYDENDNVLAIEGPLEN